MVRKIQINISDRGLYILIAIVAIVVFAVVISAPEPGSDPSTLGHTASQIDFSGAVLDNLRISGVTTGVAQEFKSIYIPVNVSGVIYYLPLYDVIVPPAAPSNLTASDRSVDTDLKIYLRWAVNSDNEVNFEIERSFDGTSFSNLVTIPENSYDYYDLSAVLSVGNTYWYRVRACNVGGCSGYSNIGFATIDPFTSPDFPDDGCLAKLCELS